MNLRIAVIVPCLALLSCAEGNSSRSDRSSSRDTRRPALEASVDLQAPLEATAPDRPRDLTRSADQARDHGPAADHKLDKTHPPDLKPADTKPFASDACPKCGPGMKCWLGKCVCDPTTCAGCCTSDGSLCQAGNTSNLCGSNGAVCASCLSDTCNTRSCATGVCQVTPITPPPYPCPGTYGTACGANGISCLSGMTCVTFPDSDGIGYCTKTCSYVGDTCTGTPKDTIAKCNLTGTSGEHYCGFTCFPGTCPIGTYCVPSTNVCEPT